MIVRTPVSETHILAQRQALAEQQKAPQRHEQRSARLHQQAVDRRGILQGVIGDRVVGGEAGEREQRQRADMLADRRPVPRERHRGEWQQDDERAAPAEAGEHQGRNVSGTQAADNRVDGPEQRGQGQQKIRLIEQSPVLAAARIGLCFRHECVSPWRSRPRSVHLSGKQLSWTAAKDQCRERMVPSRFCRSATHQSRHRGAAFWSRLLQKISVNPTA